MDYIKTKLALIKHHIYRIVTNYSMKGHRWARVLVIYTYQKKLKQEHKFYVQSKSE